MKRFIQNNQEFNCVFCGKKVATHPTSSRDHCNYCLYGLHVDINPGDRQNPCKGLLKPIGIDKSNSKTQIYYVCETCGVKLRNIIASDDDYDKIIEISLG